MTLREKIANAVGKLIATTYAALCALGTTNKVAFLLGKTALGFAAGSLTFFANLAMFWTVVPKMFIKMTSKMHSVYDDSFEVIEVGENGKDTKKYLKLESNQKHLQIRGWRWWTINGFIYLFGSSAALVYTGLLLGGLKSTLSWIIPSVATMGTLPFLSILIPFAVISFGANWPFNTMDASEAFSKHDFIPKLKARIKRWFGKDEDLDLRVEGEDSLTKNQLYARKAIRALLLVSIFGLICMGIFSIANLGIGNIFHGTRFLAAQLNLPYSGLFEPIAHGFLLTFNCVAMGYFTLGATARFSSLATTKLVEFGNYYASIGDEYPKPRVWKHALIEYPELEGVMKGVMHATLVVPVTVVIGTAVLNLVGYLGNNVLKALGYRLDFSAEHIKQSCQKDFETYKAIQTTSALEMAQQKRDYGTIPAESDDDHWSSYLLALNKNPLKKAWYALKTMTLAEIHPQDYKKYKKANPQGSEAGFKQFLGPWKIAGSSAAALFNELGPWNPSQHGTKVDLPEFIVNYLARPIAAIGVTIARFCLYSIDLIALGNALCNGALAHDGGHAGTTKNITSMIGNTAGSGEAYVNADKQRKNVDSGEASTEQEAVPVKTLYFAHQKTVTQDETTTTKTVYARYHENSRIEDDNKPEAGSYIIDGALEDKFKDRGCFLPNR
jgi:hypothetical protein